MSAGPFRPPLRPPSSVREAMAWAAQGLRGQGVPDPEGDARRLMLHCLDAASLAAHLPDPVPPRFADLVLRRATERAPVAHLTGQRLFWGHRLEVTPDVLDPRPETETLVALALERPAARVLDLGTGSGAILLALLAEWSDASGLGTDRSEAALAVARRNATALGIDRRARFVQGDWLTPVVGRHDLVVCNPPYVAEAEMAALAPELAHEPRDALTPGGDGLDAYRAVFAGLSRVLAPGARALFEIGAEQGRQVAALAEAAGLGPASVHPDIDGRDRVVALAPIFP